jgi:hypothetical protein
MRPKNEMFTLTGRNGDTTGPGHYEQEKALGKTAPNYRFGRGEARAPFFDAKNTPAPGHYMPKAKKSMTVTSSFTSESARLNFMQDIPNPGPGEYTVAGGGVRKESLRDQHPELQYFGSTTERFKQGKGDKAPGPGQYPTPEQLKRPPPKRSWSGANRFDPSDKLAHPGPGAYDTQAEPRTSGPLGTVSILGSTGSLAFGSMQTRRSGAPPAEGRAPGPGAYTVVDVGEGGVHGPGGKLARGKKGTQTSVFASDLSKEWVHDRAVKDGLAKPPVGAYDPKSTSEAGAVMRLPPRSEGFLSCKERVMMDVKPAVAPGPGRYNPPIGVTGCRRGPSFNRSVQEGAPLATGKAGSMGFDTQARRFPSKPPSKQVPGPGAYEPRSSLVSKTHNVNFGDV